MSHKNRLNLLTMKKMIEAYVFLLLLLAPTFSSLAINPTRVSKDTTRTNPTFSLEHQGTLTAVQNPLTPAQLITCFEDGPLTAEASNAITCARSSNSGKSWSKTLLKKLDTYITGKYVSVSRPTVAWSSSGTIFLVVTALDSKLTQTLLIMSSTDKGITFSKPKLIFTTSGLDIFYPSLAVNNESGNARKGTLYLTYTRKSGSTSALYFTKSTDKGVSWSKSKKISASTITSTTNIENKESIVSVGANGELEVIWTRMDADSQGAPLPVLVSSRSSKGVSVWSAPKKIVEHNFIDTSLILTQASAPSTFYAPKSNTQYVSYQIEETASFPSVIEMTKRARTGSSWSTPVRIARPVFAHECFNPSIAGDGDKKVVVVFQCLINSETKIQSYKATSSNGGATFSLPSAIFTSNFALTHANNVYKSNSSTTLIRFLGLRTALLPFVSGYGYLSGGSYFSSISDSTLKQVDILFAPLS